MSVLRCRTCGSGVLVRDGNHAPERCNNCDPVVRAFLADAAAADKALTPAERDQVERRTMDRRGYVVLIPVEGDPRLEVVPGLTLELRWLQDRVGGWIEELPRSPRLVGTRAVMVVNEDGRRLHLPHNPIASALHVRDSIVGPTLLVGVGRTPSGPDLVPLNRDTAEALRLVAVLAGEAR
jgi:hypothetical protein